LLARVGAASRRQDEEDIRDICDLQPSLQYIS
jgi:hypothetical protein